jgi:hypothetical protein
METLPDSLCYRGETNEPPLARFPKEQAMRRIRICTPVLVAGLAACGPSAPEQPERNQTERVAPTANPAQVNRAEQNIASPADHTALVEPRGPIDPKSAEAAGQVVQSYGALIEQGRWTESWKLWSDAAAARQFDRNWRDFSEIHLEIGELGELEGAAGSIYMTMPVVFYGKRKNGTDSRERAGIVLRRVNDVPGSTEAQRRWHIENIHFFRI